LIKTDMKFKSAMSLAAVALMQSAVAETSLYYINDGIVQSPPDPVPQIDAFNFVNNNLFQVDLLLLTPIRPYYTYNTLNFINRGTISVNLGFDFQNLVTDAPMGQQFRWARSFDNVGVINAGTTNVPGWLTIAATNISSSGTLYSSENSYFNLIGSDVNLSRGLVQMAGFTDIASSNNPTGMFDYYWAASTNVDNLNALLNFNTPDNPRTPPHLVEDRYAMFSVQQLFLSNSIAYTDMSMINGNPSNVLIRIAFVQNTNSAMTANVYFPLSGEIAVEWVWTNKVLFSSQETTDYLYLFDSLGIDDPAAFGLVPTGNAGDRITYTPLNYLSFGYGGIFGYPFLRGGPRLTGEVPATPGLTVPILPGNVLTNRNTAYRAVFQPLTVLPSDQPGQNATNLPGRMAISATNTLDLTETRIVGPNTLELSSTNHLISNQGAQIAVPLAYINLRNTNGLITITNLMVPTIPRPEGEVDLWSARWSVVIAGVTNTYHVLTVDSKFNPTSPGRIQDLRLSADNLVISDILNITRFFTFDGVALTITTNTTGAFNPVGGINVISPTIAWSSATPRLSYLTNNGEITTLNAVYFGGARTSPYYNSTFNEPYQTFVNRGTVSDQGSLIWSRYFENTGALRCSSGSFSLDSITALLSGGSISTPGGDVIVNTDTLVVSNTPIIAGRLLSLNVTNYLDDGGLTNGNIWNVGRAGYSAPGLSLLSRPAVASLLGTTITNFAPAFAEFGIVWAGADRGANLAGFNNNAAVGHMIFDAENERSDFKFTPARGTNALYIKTLELRNFATNRNETGDLIAFNILTNMTVYFGQAIAEGVGDVSEKVNGINGGRLVWVPGYPADGILPGWMPPPPPTIVTILPPSGTGGSTNNTGTTTTNWLPELEYPGGEGSGSGWAAAAGSYNGLFHSTEGVTLESSGSVQLKISGARAYSGKLVNGRNTYPVSGVFSADGHATNVFPRAGSTPLRLALEVDLDHAGQVRGHAYTADWSSELVADKLANAGLKAGDYTMVIPGDHSKSSADQPLGDGYGTLKVDANGYVQWKGVLADGTRVTQKSGLSQDGVWPLYVPTHGGKGLVMGWLQFTNQTLGGTMVWIKQAGAPAVSYGGGFTNRVETLGSRYTRPAKGAKILPITTGQVVLTGAGLSSTNVILLDARNRVVPQNGARLNLTISPSTGLFRGWVIADPVTGRATTFSGVICQEDGVGAGFFLMDGQSGQVLLSPAP
jgi:hypothetical protein